MLRKGKSKALKIKVLTVILAAAAFVTLFGIRQGLTSVVGGPHDLSQTGPGTFTFATDQVCVFCHTPHGANINQSYYADPGDMTYNGTAAPQSGGLINGLYLWNRQAPERSFSIYTSATLEQPAGYGQPGLVSMLCLSCHDGIGAMNVLLNYPAGATFDGNGYLFGVGGRNQFGDFSVSDPFVGPLNIAEGQADGGSGTQGDPLTGLDLTNDHPIGMVYTDIQALDAGLRSTGDVLNFTQTLVDRLDITEGRLECSTCHDAHVTNPDGNKFLVLDNTNSYLCTRCHLK